MAALARIARGTAGAFGLALSFALLGEPAAQARDTHIVLGERANPPVGWVQFCRDEPDDCREATTPAMLALTRETMATLARVNAHVNTAIEPATDLEMHGVVERWSYPIEGRGDCEDYVLLKKRMLIRAGLPAGALLIAVVREPNGDGHAVLLVRTSRGDLVLDNQREEILPWRETGYRFVMAQSPDHPAIWLRLGPAAAPAVTAAR